MTYESSLILIVLLALAIMIWWRFVLWLVVLALVALLILGAIQIASMGQTNDAPSTVDAASDPHTNPYHCLSHTGSSRDSEVIGTGPGE
jgi:O-antigen ligase